MSTESESVRPPHASAEITNTASQFLLAEYSALRAEVLQRSEAQHQLVSLALTGAGVLISVGLERNSTTVILAYPVFAVFLSAAWSQHDIRIGEIGTYIRERIENKLLGNDLGWKHAHTGSRLGLMVGSRSFLASRGILVGTQLLAVILASLKFRLTVLAIDVDTLLLLLDVAAIVLTLSGLSLWVPSKVQQGSVNDV
jgi:hypothetical protein